MKGLELSLAVPRAAAIMIFFIAGQPWASYWSFAWKLCPDKLEAQLGPRDHQECTLSKVQTLTSEHRAAIT